jgi:hypothetical protein
MDPNTCYETPMMCFYRINQQRGGKQEPSKKDMLRWTSGCLKDPEANRRVYLMLRETIDVGCPTRRESIRRMTEIEKGHPVITQVFGDLF